MKSFSDGSQNLVEKLLKITILTLISPGISFLSIYEEWEILSSFPYIQEELHNLSLCTRVSSSRSLMMFGTYNSIQFS